MSIPEFINRINPVPERSSVRDLVPETVEFDDEGHIIRHSMFDKLFLAVVIVLVTSLSFGIGRLSVVGEREGVQILYENLDNNQGPITNVQASPSSQTGQAASVINALPSAAGTVVASKNGSKYHYSHCSGAKQIKEENKVTFPSPSAAEASGYTLAANCKPR